MPRLLWQGRSTCTAIFPYCTIPAQDNNVTCQTKRNAHAIAAKASFIPVIRTTTVLCYYTATRRRPPTSTLYRTIFLVFGVGARRHSSICAIRLDYLRRRLLLDRTPRRRRRRSPRSLPRCQKPRLSTLPWLFVFLPVCFSLLACSESGVLVRQP